MTAYIFLYGMIFSAYAVIRRIKGYTGKKPMIYAQFISGILTVLLGLRHPSMGVDLGYGNSYGYLPSFDYFASLTWLEILKMGSFQNYEKGYVLFNKLVSSIWHNNQFFLFCCAAISIVPIGHIIGKYSKNCRTSFLIYLGLTVFHILFSGLRQAIAVSIAFYGFSFVKERKLKQYSLTILLACLFHRSALVALLIYPLYWMKLDRTARLITLGVLPAFFVLRVPLWNWIVRITGKSSFAEHNGSVTLLLAFCLIYVYLIIFSTSNRKNDGLINIHYVSCCMLIFTEVNTIAQRAGYYYMIYTILLLPEVLDDIKHHQGKKEYQMHYLTIVGCFLLFAIYSLVNATWSRAYPFYFFGENLYR